MPQPRIGQVVGQGGRRSADLDEALAQVDELPHDRVIRRAGSVASATTTVPPRLVRSTVPGSPPSPPPGSGAPPPSGSRHRP